MSFLFLDVVLNIVRMFGRLSQGGSLRNTCRRVGGCNSVTTTTAITASSTVRVASDSSRHKAERGSLELG